MHDNASCRALFQNKTKRAKLRLRVLQAQVSFSPLLFSVLLLFSLRNQTMPVCVCVFNSEAVTHSTTFISVKYLKTETSIDFQT